MMKISERSIADLKTLNRVIYIKCAQVLYIENRASLCDVIFQRKTMYKKYAHCASNENFCIAMSIFI